MVAKKSPTILTTIGVSGVFTTTVMGIKATPLAIERLEAAKIGDEELTTWEVVKTAGPVYIPTIAIGAITVTSIIFANRINLKRQAILLSAYQIADNRAKEWSEKVEEMFGERKKEAVHDEIMKEHMEANPASKNQVIVTGGGDVLCYDDFTGRYFRSTADKIRRIVAELNVKLTDDLYVPINDYFWELGLEQTSMGDTFGWAVSDVPIAAIFSTHMSDLNEPCLAVSFNISPRVEYYS